MDKDRSGEYTGGIFLERYLPISIKDLKKSQCFNIRSHKRTNVQRHRSIRLATAGQFSSIQLSHSVMSDSATPWTSARQASLSITNSRSPPKPMSIESVMPSNNLILCHPLLLLRSIFPSIRVFSNESALCISGQSIGVAASTSVLPMNTRDWSPLGWTGWISLQSKGLSRVFSNTTVQKHQFFGAQLSL